MPNPEESGSYLEYLHHRKLTLASIAEQLAMELDDDYREELSDAVVRSVGGTEPGGWLTTTLGFSARRIRDVFLVDGHEFQGEIATTKYMIESEIMASISREELPPEYEASLHEQFDKELLDDPTTEYLVVYDQTYILADDGTCAFECEVKFIVDGHQIDLEDDDEDEGEHPLAASVLVGRGVSEASDYTDDGLGDILSKGDLAFLSELEDKAKGRMEDMESRRPVPVLQAGANESRLRSLPEQLDCIENILARLAEGLLVKK